MSERTVKVPDHISVPRSEYNAMAQVVLAAERVVLNESWHNIRDLNVKLSALHTCPGWEFLRESTAEVPLPAPPAEVPGTLEERQGQ